MEPKELQHLLTLASYDLQAHEIGHPHPEVVGHNLQRLIDQLEYCPAWVTGERGDICAWNRAAVGKVRACYARHVDDPWFNELIQVLRARSPELVT